MLAFFSSFFLSFKTEMIIMIILNYKHVLRVHRDYFFWKNEPGSRLPCCCGYIFFDHPVDKPLMVVFSLNGFMGTTNAFFKPSIPLVQIFFISPKNIPQYLLITGMFLSLLAFRNHLLQVILSCFIKAPNKCKFLCD